jgi:hypothetical protein
MWMVEVHYPSKGVKRKAIPVTGSGGPWGCDAKAPIFCLDHRLTNGGTVVSATRRPPFAPPGRFLELISVRD